MPFLQLLYTKAEVPKIECLRQAIRNTTLAEIENVIEGEDMTEVTVWATSERSIFLLGMEYATQLAGGMKRNIHTQKLQYETSQNGPATDS